MKRKINTYLAVAVLCASLVSCSFISGVKETREINKDKLVLMNTRNELAALRNDIIANEKITMERLKVFYNPVVDALVTQCNLLIEELEIIDKSDDVRYLDWRERVLEFARQVHKLKRIYQKEIIPDLDKLEGVR